MRLCGDRVSGGGATEADEEPLDIGEIRHGTTSFVLVWTDLLEVKGYGFG
jgi:hypothetical protein